MSEKGTGRIDDVMLMLGIKVDDDQPVQPHTDTDTGDALETPPTTDRVTDSPDPNPIATARMVSAVETLLKGVGENIERQGLRQSAYRYVRWLQATTAGYGMDAVQCPVGNGETVDGSDIMGPGTPDALSSETSDTCSDDMPPDPGRGACFVNLREYRGGQEGAAHLSPSPSPELSLKTAEPRWHGNDCTACEMEVISLSFGSQCEHHLLPFYGTVRIVYMPPLESNSDAVARQLSHIVATFSKRLQVQERLTQQIADAAAAVLGVNESVDDGSGGWGAVLVVCESMHMCMVARGVAEHASATMTSAVRGAWVTSHAERRAALRALLSQSQKGDT